MSIAQHYASWLRKEADHRVASPTKAEVLRQAARTIEELEREAIEGRADKARLDWLSDVNNTIGNVQLPAACVLANPHSLRDAIDMAMGMEETE